MNFEGKSFWIATPMYGGLCHGGYVNSLIRLIAAICSLGGKVNFDYIINEALISRARNILSSRFLDSDFSTLVFLDGDIEFAVDDFLKMLSLSGPDYPVLGGAYPMKRIDWERVKAANADPSLMTGTFVFNTVKQKAGVSEPLEVTEVGTGLMVIDRSAFTRMAKEIPEDEIVYHPITGDNVSQSKAYAYFQDGIDPHSKTFLSEDYWFCRAWRRLGGKVHLCPWIKTIHYGTYGFKGDIEAIFKAGFAV